MFVCPGTGPVAMVRARLACVSDGLAGGADSSLVVSWLFLRAQLPGRPLRLRRGADPVRGVRWWSRFPRAPRHVVKRHREVYATHGHSPVKGGSELQQQQLRSVDLQDLNER